MKLFSNGVVAGFCGALLASSIGTGNVEASEGPWWSKFMQEKSENALSEGSGSDSLNDEDKALSAAINAITESFESTLKTITKEARSVKGSLSAAEDKVKTSLRNAANLIQSELKEVKREIKPLLSEIKAYMLKTQKDVALLLPAKGIVGGLAHMVHLIKEKQQITMADHHVKRFVARLINLMLTLSSFFSFYVITTSGPVLWGLMLAPLAMFNFVKMSTSSMVQESYLQEVEAKEAEWIVKRTAETGMPVSRSNGEEIASFLKAISNEELKQMAKDSDIFNKTGINLNEFPELFRRAVTNWFIQDPK